MSDSAKIIKPEIRQDYIQEKFVIIAPKRTARPHDNPLPSKKEKHPSDDCIFCPHNINNVPSLYRQGDKENWQINVILNKYPAVSLDNPNAYGQQEVVIETSDHTKELEELSVDHVAKLLDAYSIRTMEISKNKKIEYILIFKNNGGIAGASLQHAHSQIFATKFLPPHLFDKSQRQQAYKLNTGHCIYCDVINKEKSGPRFVYKDEHVIAFTPYASTFNYEVWILPLRHVDNITDLNEDEKRSWAKIMRFLLKKIGQLDLPYNFYFHQVINDNDQHLYMKIVPRGSIWAGVEIGSGLIINPISPEDAAEFYRYGLSNL